MKTLALKVAETFPLIQDASDFDPRKILKCFQIFIDRLLDLLLDICISVRESTFQSFGSTYKCEVDTLLCKF
jgi:hypothetical protein